MFEDMLDLVQDAAQKQNAGKRHQERRKKLLELVAEAYPDKQGTLLLSAHFEMDCASFVQDSSFFYFTGISEPATMLTIDTSGSSTLWAPNFNGVREKWVDVVDVINKETISLFGIDAFKYAGAIVPGYSVNPYFSGESYQLLIEHLMSLVQKKQTIFVSYMHGKQILPLQKMIIDRLCSFIPGLQEALVDISPLIAKLRRKKDMHEIETLYQAMEITNAGMQSAAHMLQPNVSEAELHAAITYLFIENEADDAYAPIIAGAKRATMLHYTTNNATLRDGDMVLIDAGARYRHYCADITRVFPVSGKFTQKQKDLYTVVLETQKHVAKHVRPGMYLMNHEEQEKSLHHIAVQFLQKHGYEKYFIHSIGHYLGLDVHDVGERTDPLQEGDVITIEPGVYLPDQSMGIRIEDNYWVVEDADPVCLSEAIPKEISDIEALVQNSFD